MREVQLLTNLMAKKRWKTELWNKAWVISETKYLPVKVFYMLQQIITSQASFDFLVHFEDFYLEKYLQW